MSSGFKVNNTDLDSIFQARGGFPARADVNFNTNGTDLSDRFMSIDDGERISGNTNFKSGGVDLADLFSGPLGANLWTGGGSPSFGRLGLNNNVFRSSPSQIGSSAIWTKISRGTRSHVMVISTSGTLWAFGANNGGQLGLGNRINRSSPVQIGALTDWKEIAGNRGHSIAVKTNGTLWAWGDNVFGSLGLGNTVPRSSPVQVGALTDWKQVTGGYNMNVAVKTNGTMWSWGVENSLGLGTSFLNPFRGRSSPVQIGALTDWKEASGTNYNHFGIKTNNTLWAWGRGDKTGLGYAYLQGDVLSPIQVGVGTDWKQVDMSGSMTIAVKTGGTLWTWGRGDFAGPTGLNNLSNPLYPTQVGALTNWKWVATSNGGYKSGATKTDGTLWTWGRNWDGSLGFNDRIYRSSPAQVGALTDWKTVNMPYMWLARKG